MSIFWFGFMITRCRGMVSWLRSMISWFWCMISWFWCMISWSRVISCFNSKNFFK